METFTPPGENEFIQWIVYAIYIGIAVFVFFAVKKDKD